MKKSDFFYELPEELIAQHPLKQRDASRLLHVDKNSGELEHRHFSDVLDYLRPGDCLILNNTRVLPCRLYGVKEGTGAVVEFLLLTQLGVDEWECITGPGKKARTGSRFSFGEGKLFAEVTDVKDDGNRVVKFEFTGNFFNILDEIGQMPLPHYITEALEDKERYQTVYNKTPGSAAAPTAGLHFTPELLEKIKNAGINIGYVTLHVGLGTFRPVKADNIEDHKMHSEHYWMPKETADLILNTKKSGGRVIAVGTTSCRTLESVANSEEGIRECEGATDIFIYPGYKFKCIDALITNFHLPESTLIMLVSAFLGYDKTMNAYKTAVLEKYRFFSFGDSMMIS
ncbi:MAG: tRNA preQ1(34) S-adenosylmethionine ribosyltransferase-isomerase QueA [Oscillospiraceae bacterium]|nr:tRNA preQ1(34) S-adenosylmethionine ribosyltransferase-isomerase QueA [Oscillospiraceae bacterium]